MGLTIRSAEPEDVGEIAAVQLRAAMTGYADIFPADAPKPTPDGLEVGWRELLAGAGDVLVAAGEDGVAGVVAVKVDEEVPHGLLLTRLYVDPRRWGRGVGGMLHDAALGRAADGGAELINLWVLEANTRARGMYERRGWSVVPGRLLRHASVDVVEVLYGREVGGV